MNNRRTVIRQLLIISAGTALLPSCTGNYNNSNVSFHNFKITTQEEGLLAGVTETIIPTDLTPGALSISAHHFVLKMLDDCYTGDQQDEFLRGLRQFDKASREAYLKSFLGSSVDQRENCSWTLKQTKLDTLLLLIAMGK